MAINSGELTNETSYTTVQKWLHGISALIIVWLMSSGFYIALGPVSDTFKSAISAFNVSTGAVFIPLFLFRMYVSFGKCCSGLITSKSFVQCLAFFVHAMMYLATAIILISGVLMMDRDINIFGFFSIPSLIDNSAHLEGFASIHDVACLSLTLLFILHVAAVIKHQWVGQSVIKRMFS